MITLLDIVAIFITPLLLGLAAVWCFQNAAKLGAAVGMWVAFVSCYVFRLTLEDWSILEGDAKSAGAFVISLKSAFGQLVSPTAGLRWLPLAATGILVIHGISLFFADRQVGDDQHDRSLSGRRSRVFHSVTLAAFFATCFGLMARLLWTSIYLTDSYSMWQHTAFVTAPAFALAAIWWSGTLRRNASEDSVLGVIALAAVTLSVCVLLGASGSIQYAMFTGGAMTFPFILLWHLRLRRHGELARPIAGIVAVAVGTPVVLGYYFAEVTLISGLLALSSIVMLMVMWPTRNSSQARQWAMALLPVLPVMVAAVFAVTGMMNEGHMTPDAGSNPYSNL